MQTKKIPFDKVLALSFKDVHYQSQPETLKSFYRFSPDIKGIEEAIKERKKIQVNRLLLHDVLSDNYSINASSSQKINIEFLKDSNTFTIITAHQPSLLGGPAYYFYKICSTIHLSQYLSEQYPEYKFLPVFISGSEDHDFEEVKSLHLYNRHVEWATNQSGPVGRFNISGLDEVLNIVSDILGSTENAETLTQVFKTSLANANNYNDFVFSWLNYFFKDYGLLILNMDDKRLKSCFANIMIKEIKERRSASLVQETQEELLKHGFKPQAFARDINIFYMAEGSRERIYYEDGKFLVNHSSTTFSEVEIIHEIEKFPERFSPNVILRPIYQEYILPNIAYIGGGGEIAYWLERKKQFDYYDVFFPVLIRRNSVMLMSKSLIKTMDKLNLTLEDILLEEDKVITKYLESAANGDFHLNDEILEIQEVYNKIAAKAKLIDPTLEPFVLGEGHKTLKSSEAIEVKLKRTLKQKEETSVNQIKSLKSKLFPDGSLQERKESLLPYLVTENLSFIEKLIDELNPLKKEFLFIYL